MLELQNAPECPECMGADVGGTQISALTDLTDEVFAIPADVLKTFGSLGDALRYLFMHLGTPKVLVIGAAGAVAGKDGSIRLTNRSWPRFFPKQFEEETGCRVIVVNDMQIKAAGRPLAVTKVIREGREDSEGEPIIITVSTGVGATKDKRKASEGGHIFWQPANELEDRLLCVLREQLGTRNISVEELIGGSHLLKLYDALNACGYFLRASDDRKYIDECRDHDIGIGPFITSGAIERSDYFCEVFMEVVGSVFGQFLRSLALVTLATEISFTGGVMQPEVVRYITEKTSFWEAYYGGSAHRDLLDAVQFILIDDPKVGVRGALELAKAAL